MQKAANLLFLVLVTVTRRKQVNGSLPRNKKHLDCDCDKADYIIIRLLAFRRVLASRSSLHLCGIILRALFRRRFNRSEIEKSDPVNRAMD